MQNNDSFCAKGLKEWKEDRLLFATTMREWAAREFYEFMDGPLALPVGGDS
jgi:hypothetical protein